MHYKIINMQQLQRRSMIPEKIDPRSAFYEALIASQSYEQYLEKLGGNRVVYPPSYAKGAVAISAEKEYRYARSARGWIKEIDESAAQDSEESEESNRLSLKDLVSRKAIIRAIEEAKRLGRNKFISKYGFKQAREYLLNYDGKKYDSKAIAGAAFQFLFPGAVPLTPKDLNGGIKGAAGHLARLGFEIDGIQLKETDWDIKEVDSTVKNYFEMLKQDLAGKSINKAENNRQLREKLRNRNHSSVELKHQNISAVLQEQGLPWLKGYAPGKNAQLLLRAVVKDYLSDHPEIFDSVPAQWAEFAKKEVFVEPPKIGAFRKTARARHGVRVDFGERDQKNRDLGKAGEEWVLKVVKEELRKVGRDDLAMAVNWASKEIGDGLGYDIESFKDNGSPLFIEVKTTNGSIAAPFLITPNEMQASEEEGDSYAIYRVFNFSKDPKVYVLMGSVSDSCEIKPCLWQAVPKG